jgi:penicillin-binding protein 1C
MTVGVWVGRPDGAPVPGLVGRGTAAPILFEAFARSGSAPAALPRAPKGAIFATSGKLPPPLQRFGVIGPCEGAEAPRIMFPPDGARLEMAAGGQLVALKISGGRGPLTVLVNGVPMGVPMSASGGRGTLFFQPDGPGFVRLTVMDARGASDSVIVRLQ